MSTLQLGSDSETGNWKTRMNPIQMLNSIHKLNSIFELMYMTAQVNGIRVEGVG